MTISAYVGLPGHGKSYGVVENVILPALKNGRTIFTNIPINSEKCLKKYKTEPVNFHIDDILKNENWFNDVFESGSILIIDECWRLWPNGQKASNTLIQHKSFLAEHRHMVGENGHSTEIVLVVQDLANIANFARSLVETTYRVVKLSNVGLNSRYRVDIYSGCVTGPKPLKSARENSIHSKFKKNVFEFYQSHTQSKTGIAGDETRIDNRNNILKSPWILFALAFMSVLAVFFYFGFEKVTDYYGPSSSKKSPNNMNQLTTVSTKLKTVKVQTFKFLSLADELNINFNLGKFPNIDYVFSIIFPDSQVDLDQFQLAKLGYRLKPISNCMVKIEGADYSGFALCTKDEDEKNGFVQSLITPSQI